MSRLAPLAILARAEPEPDRHPPDHHALMHIKKTSRHNRQPRHIGRVGDDNDVNALGNHGRRGSWRGGAQYSSLLKFENWRDIGEFSFL